MAERRLGVDCRGAVWSGSALQTRTGDEPSSRVAALLAKAQNRLMAGRGSSYPTQRGSWPSSPRSFPYWW
jgi:hypothetical protein